LRGGEPERSLAQAPDGIRLANHHAEPVTKIAWLWLGDPGGKRAADGLLGLDQPRSKRGWWQGGVCQGHSQPEIGIRRQIEQLLQPQVRDETVRLLADDLRGEIVAADACAQHLEFRLRPCLEAHLRLA
jgi:hypothetical protein